MSEEKEFLEKALEDLKKEMELIDMLEERIHEMRALAETALHSQEDHALIQHLQDEVIRIQLEVYDLHRRKQERLH